MMIDLEEFEEEYTDLADDVLSASYNTYEDKLRDFFHLMDTSKVSAPTIKVLEANFNFDEWYSNGKSSAGGMVGSGKLVWSKDKILRLEQYVGLFRHFSQEEKSFIDFTIKFMYAGSNYNDMIQEINSELFERFSRDLLKKNPS